MGKLDRFAAYAAAFEEAYATDDWSKLDPFFTTDAVYETIAAPPFGGRNEGYPAVKAHFKQICDTFDRRFDSRSLAILEGPTERDGVVWFRWAAIYTLAGAPDMRMEGEETVVFAGDRIQRLEDRVSAAEGERTMAYLAAHGSKLRAS